MYVFNIEAMNSIALLHIMSDVSGVTADWPIILHEPIMNWIIRFFR